MRQIGIKSDDIHPDHNPDPLDHLSADPDPADLAQVQAASAGTDHHSEAEGVLIGHDASTA
jgi:hypothetical protein